MNGPQDMGGFIRFGAISPERDEPVFHSEWERRAFGMVLCVGALGKWNIDIARHARERIPARSYWASSYYEIWLKGMETLLREYGLATERELESGKPAGPSPQGLKILKAESVPGVLARGGPASRPSNRPQLFGIGNKVRVRNITPQGHTRLVRYARGRVGEIVLAHGTHVFPDSSAHGKGDDPQWLYAVRFTAKELWGRDNNDAVNIDLWEPYLEPL